MINPLVTSVIVVLHVLAVVGFFVIKNLSLYTVLLQLIMYILGGISITAGYHRLWCHRTYKAHPFLEWLYMIFGSSTGQGGATQWSRTHRTHHRNEDQDTDPYSIKKGFFFAHMGWVCQNYDPETQKEIDKTDVSDLENNPILQFQTKHVRSLWVITSFVVPMLVSRLWGETILNSFFSSVIRQVFLMHCIWSVNSFAHMYGEKPYNTNIQPSENPLVSLFTFGEGWHNFHHTYPKDYRASDPDKFNPTTFFIDSMASNDLVHDRKEMCEKTKGDKFDPDNYCKLE
jgi:stearoyl-CoA desaturase (delta-9 desaturase)